jgi:phospholipid/cholesterol/gamma-HCH transport system substrate-binding protein
MPSQQEVKWSQLKVGIIVLISIALLTLLLFLMTSASGMGVFSKKIVVHTYFENSSGLKVGAPVSLEGVTIGEVTKVTVTTEPAHKLTPVLVVMKLEPKYHESVHADSKASLSTVGVLGDTVVDIDDKTAVGPELQDGAELRTLETPNLADVIKAGQGTVESLNVILAKVNRILDTVQSGQGSAGKLISDPALYNKATATMDELHTLTVKLNGGKGSAGKLLNDDALYENLTSTLKHTNELLAGIEAGKGSAGKLLKDDGLYDNLNSTLKHTNSLLGDVDAGKGSLGVLIKDPAFATKLTATVDKLNTLLTNVNDGKGSLGKFVTDDAAYNNLNTLLTSSTDLVTAVRKDPKKYLVIHLKIF